MDKAIVFLLALWHGFIVAAPWLVASFIPSLITGLTPYPKAKGAVAALRKLLAVLSWVTHADQEGTFKRLFSLGAPPVSQK